jgi:membrane fusion protein (multidrug efflux system)
MYITFPVSQRDILQPQINGRTGELKDVVKVRIRFSDGSNYDQVGTVNFIDVTVDKSTDTVLARAIMPNSKGVLIDGQLVRVLVEIGLPEEQVVIPQGALIADQDGIYVFVVENGNAAVKRVKPAKGSGSGDVVIESGLSGGEQVIVEGIQGVRPGLTVRAKPLPASLRGNG